MTAETITFGGTGHEWQRPARKCAKCKRKVTRGIVRPEMIGLEYEPSFKVLCWECFYGLAEETASPGELESYEAWKSGGDVA